MRRRGPVGSLADSEEKALQISLRYLTRRSRSEAEVRDRLEEAGASDSIVRKTLERLRSLNYIDDESFARRWAADRAQNRHYGRKRIEQELRLKGVAESVAIQAIRDAFIEADERENAKGILIRRYSGQDLRDPRTRRRAAAFLERRGYSAQIISDLLARDIEED
ncbi:MAG TPA: regulatory protein RecX [Candidatus Binatia bacterium]